jgi:hypothetical protein
MTPNDLLQLVYDRFRTTGTWPLVRDLYVDLRKEGSFRVLAAEVGLNKIVCEDGPEGVCRLLFETIAECRNSEEDIQNVLAALRFTAERFIVDKLGTISGDDIAISLKLKRVPSSRLEYFFPDAAEACWTSHTAVPGGGFVNMQLKEQIVLYESVTTFEEFIAIRTRLRQEPSAIGRRMT